MIENTLFNKVLSLNDTESIEYKKILYLISNIDLNNEKYFFVVHGDRIVIKYINDNNILSNDKLVDRVHFVEKDGPLTLRGSSYNDYVYTLSANFIESDDGSVDIDILTMSSHSSTFSIDLKEDDRKEVVGVLFDIFKKLSNVFIESFLDDVFKDEEIGKNFYRQNNISEVLKENN